MVGRGEAKAEATVVTWALHHWWQLTLGYAIFSVGFILWWHRGVKHGGRIWR